MKIRRRWTKGPWQWWDSCSWRRLGTEDQSSIIMEPTRQRDGHPDLHFRNGGYRGPDAKLIAAAPDLAEALAEAYTTLADTGCTDHDGWSPCGDCDNCKSLRACYDALRKAGALEEESGE